MSVSDTIRQYVPIGRKPKIERSEALAIVPVRHPLVKWERNDAGEVILQVPMRDDRTARAVKAIIKAVRMAKELPENRQVGLDEVGSFVWELCDGERDINAVVLAVSKEYKLTRREAEASVTMFLQMLAKKNLIGLMSAGGKKSGKKKRK